MLYHSMNCIIFDIVKRISLYFYYFIISLFLKSVSVPQLFPAITLTGLMRMWRCPSSTPSRERTRSWDWKIKTHSSQNWAIPFRNSFGRTCLHPQGPTIMQSEFTRILRPPRMTPTMAHLPPYRITEVSELLWGFHPRVWDFAGDDPCPRGIIGDLLVWMETILTPSVCSRWPIHCRIDLAI